MVYILILIQFPVRIIMLTVSNKAICRRHSVPRLPVRREAFLFLCEFEFPVRIES